MVEVTEDGFRRTHYSSRDKERLNEKIEMFKERGEETKILESAGRFYLYVKKEKELEAEA